MSGFVVACIVDGRVVLFVVGGGGSCGVEEEDAGLVVDIAAAAAAVDVVEVEVGNEDWGAFDTDGSACPDCIDADCGVVLVPVAGGMVPAVLVLIVPDDTEPVAGSLIFVAAGTGLGLAGIGGFGTCCDCVGGCVGGCDCCDCVGQDSAIGGGDGVAAVRECNAPKASCGCLGNDSVADSPRGVDSTRTACPVVTVESLVTDVKGTVRCGFSPVAATTMVGDDCCCCCCCCCCCWASFSRILSVRRGLLASGSLSPLSSTTAMGLFMGPPLLLLLPDAVGDTEGMVVVVVDDDGCGCGGVVVFAVVVVVVVVDAKVEVDVVIGKAVLAGFSRSPASDSGGISQTLVVICRLV